MELSAHLCEGQCFVVKLGVSAALSLDSTFLEFSAHHKMQTQTVSQVWGLDFSLPLGRDATCPSYKGLEWRQNSGEIGQSSIPS